VDEGHDAVADEDHGGKVLCAGWGCDEHNGWRGSGGCGVVCGWVRTDARSGSENQVPRVARNASQKGESRGKNKSNDKCRLAVRGKLSG
jgi:hypothetical protein